MLSKEKALRKGEKIFSNMKNGTENITVFITGAWYK